MLFDTLPPGFVPDPDIPLPPGCSSVPLGSDQGIRCDIGSLGSGQSTQRVISVVATAPGTFTNLVEVVHGETDPVPADNEASEETTVNQPPVTLVLEKSAPETSVELGETQTYVVRIVNEGPGPATNLQVTDQVENPKIIALRDVTPESDCQVVTDFLMNCSFAELAEGHSVIIQVTADAVGVGSTDNNAIAWADESAGNAAVDTLTTTVLPNVTADLSVELQALPAPGPGAAAFLLRAINHTAGTAMPAVNLSVVLSGNTIGIQSVELDYDGGGCAAFEDLTPPRVECNLSSLVAGDDAEVLVFLNSGTVPQTVIVTGQVSSSQGEESGPEPNAATLSLPLN